MMCHKPYNRHCEVCQLVRSRLPQHKRKRVPIRERLKSFGELVTCDHIVAEADENMSVDQHCYTVMMYDVFTQFLIAYPPMTKRGA